MKKIYFIAGEASGDFVGGRIIGNLKNNKELEIIGVGGKNMQDAGMAKSLFPISEINLMGFFEVIPHIFKIKKLISKTIEDIINKKPDLLITIDSPGFTFRVAKQVRKLLPKLKMIHVVAPSVWAYKEGRATKYARIYDCLFALLPFEPPYFTKVGLDCRYIGHPIMEQKFYSDKAALREEFKIQHTLENSRQEGLQDEPIKDTKILEQKQDLQNLLVDNDIKILCVTLGSRKGEILRHLPIFIPSIEKVYEDYKSLLVIFTLANPDHEVIIKPFLEKVRFNYLLSCDRLKNYAVSDLALAKSGTNTLEIATSGTPMVVAYKVNIFSFLIIRALIKIKYVTLINIIAGREIIPEFIQFDCNAFLISSKLKELLSDNKKAYKQITENQKILQQLGFKANQLPSYIAAKIIEKEFLE